MNELTALNSERRRLLQRLAWAGGALVWTGCGSRQAVDRGDDPSGKKPEEAEEEISPAEDLMREHGVLKRVLLIYRECIRRIDGRQDLPPDTLKNSATLIRDFIENYHEKLEEEQIFPRFRKANQLVDLVDTLYTQHQRGRTLTERIIAVATPAGLKNANDRKSLVDSMHLFVRMYEPHEAREDTVLFPALHRIVSPHEYDALGEEFEKREHEIFKGDGFDRAVDQVAGLEKSLGIYDLAQFTPPA